MKPRYAFETARFPAPHAAVPDPQERLRFPRGPALWAAFDLWQEEKLRGLVVSILCADCHEELTPPFLHTNQQEFFICEPCALARAQESFSAPPLNLTTEAMP
jgi:hypothetical protein